MQNRTVADLVREILMEWLTGSRREKPTGHIIQALNDLTLLRNKLEDQHGTYQAI